MAIHKYCTLRDGKPDHIFGEYRFFTMGCVCNKEENVYSVGFSECEESQHDFIAWKNANTGEIEYVFESRVSLEACFTYGIRGEIEKGRGSVVYLKQEGDPVYCGKAGELKRHRAEWDVM